MLTETITIDVFLIKGNIPFSRQENTTLKGQPLGDVLEVPGMVKIPFAT